MGNRIYFKHSEEIGSDALELVFLAPELKPISENTPDWKLPSKIEVEKMIQKERERLLPKVVLSSINLAAATDPPSFAHFHQTMFLQRQSGMTMRAVVL